MGYSLVASWQLLASEEPGKHLQLAPAIILSVSLARDGVATAQRGFAVPRRRLQKILLDVRPCARLRYVIQSLRSSRVVIGLA